MHREYGWFAVVGIVVVHRHVWMYCIVGAERFNKPLENFFTQGALPERVWSSKKMDPILLNKPRKPIIDGAEMVHRKPIRSSSAALGVYQRRHVDETTTTTTTSTTNVCLPRVWVMVAGSRLRGDSRYDRCPLSG